MPTYFMKTPPKVNRYFTFLYFFFNLPIHMLKCPLHIKKKFSN